MAASCRDLVDVFPLKHGDHCWFPDMVGVTQTELKDTRPPPRVTPDSITIIQLQHHRRVLGGFTWPSELLPQA